MGSDCYCQLQLRTSIATKAKAISEVVLVGRADLGRYRESVGGVSRYERSKLMRNKHAFEIRR